DVDEQQIGDHLPAREVGQGVGAGTGKDGLPEEDGGQDREEAEYGGEKEVPAVGHALDERGAEDVEILAERRPPGGAGWGRAVGGWPRCEGPPWGLFPSW